MSIFGKLFDMRNKHPDARKLGAGLGGSSRQTENTGLRDSKALSASKKTFAYPEQFSADMDLPLFEGTPETYLIASTPRCGSHLLGHALTAMKGFGVPLEYLNKGNMQGWGERFGDIGFSNLLREIVRHRTSPNGRFGLKAHWTQFSPYLQTQDLAPLGTISRVVYIYRSDLLSQAISFEKAMQTGQWISGAPMKASAEFRYDAIVRAAEGLHSQNMAWISYLSKYAEGTVFYLKYEDLVKSPESMLENIRDFIDPNSDVRPQISQRTQKQSDDLSGLWRARFLAELRRKHRWITKEFSPTNL